MPGTDDSMTIRDALARYYVEHDLPPDGGASSPWFVVRIGPLRIPLPNPPFRQRAVLYHDIHHLITGYDNVFSRGEMIIAGHEIRVGCGRIAVAWVINLWMFALGLFCTPREMFRAFVRARHCRSLYHRPADRRLFPDMTVAEMRSYLALDRPAPAATAMDRLLFVGWSAVAWIVILLSAAVVGGAVGLLYAIVRRTT